jgi:hypothetical protein
MLRSAQGGDGPTGAAADANSLEMWLHAAAQSLAHQVRAALGRGTGSLPDNEGLVVARMARVAAQALGPAQATAHGPAGEAVYDAPGPYVQEK